MMSSSFPIVPLSELVERVTKPVTVLAEESYEQIGIRSHGKGIFYKNAVKGVELGNKRVYWLEPNCFVVNIVFAWEQAIARTTDADLGKIASHRFPMFRPKQDKIDLDYLTYLFKTEFGKHLLGLASPGGAGRNKTLGQTEFMRISIPCPPIAEQRKIAAVLAAWDRAIQVVDDLIELQSQQKQLISKQLMKGVARVPGFVGEWRSKPLSELTEIIYGTSPGGVERVDGKYPILGTGGVIGFTDAHTYAEDSVIIGRKGTIDRPQLIRGPFWATDTTYYCIPKSECDLVWLYHALQSLRLRQYNEASGVPSLSRDTLYSIPLLVPSIEEQRAIGHVIQTAEELVSVLARKQATLKTERSALLQQLLTGKRRVSTKKEAA